MDLFVLYTGSSFKEGVDKSIFARFEGYAMRAGWGSPNHGHFEFIVPNLAVVQEIVNWARGLNGVREVKLNFVYDWLNFYDEALDEIITRSSVAP